MITTLDKVGRVVIPADVRRRGERLVVCPRAVSGERTEVDVARLIEEERDRWPG